MEPLLNSDDGRRQTELPAEQRLQSRVPLSVPLLITSMDPSFKLQLKTEAVDVSKLGVQIRSRYYMAPGTRLRLDVLGSDQIADGRVVRVQFDGTAVWTVGIQLMNPGENIWRIKTPPLNWSAARLPAQRYEHWNWHLQ
jgi:hypothetical protein